DVFGTTVGLGAQPVDLSKLPGGVVAPPAIRIRDASGEAVIPAPERVDEASLRRRGRERSDKLKRHGLIQSRPMNPLLACPTNRFSHARGERLRHDLNSILEEQNLPFRFCKYALYNDPQALHR